MRFQFIRSRSCAGTASRAVFSVLLLVGSLSLQAAPSTRPALPSPRTPVVQPSIQVFFSPDGGCIEAIVQQLKNAKRSIDVQAYSFTSAPIAQGLVEAQARGVKLRVVLDKSQRSAKYTSATFLFNHRVPTSVDAKHAIAHNKIILIDGTTILTGSFNFTKAAEQSNAENLLVITGQPKLYEAYAENFAEHIEHATPYEGLERAAE